MKIPTMTGSKKPSGNASKSKYSRYLIYGAIAFVALLVVVGGIALYLRSELITISRINTTISGQIGSNVTVESSGALTYNLSRYVVEYSNFHYSFRNVTSANISMEVYNRNPRFNVYLVNTESYCIDCPIASSLFTSLGPYLSQYGIQTNSSSFSLVDINEMKDIPDNSVVIIASGLMPNILLPNVTYTERCPSYTNVTLVTLLNDGDTVLYVGRNLSTSVTCSTQVVQTSQQSIQTIPELTSVSAPSGYVNGSLYFDSPTFFLSEGSIYFTSSYVNYLNGTFISLSNYPEDGWGGNMNLLSQDIAKVIAARFWMSRVADGIDHVSFSGSSAAGNMTVFTLNSTLPNVGTVGSIVNTTYPTLTLVLSNNNNAAESIVPLRANFSYTGQINIPDTAGQGIPTQISAQVFNTTRVVIARMELYNSNFSVINSSELTFGQVGPTEVLASPSFQVPSGYYIAKLVDQNNNVRAKSLFYLSGASITPTLLDFRNGSFEFGITSDGIPVTYGDYNISINGGFNYSGTVTNGTLIYALPKGTPVNYGSKTFVIGLFGNSYSLTYPYTNTGIVIPPLYIEFAIAAIFVVVLNRVLVPPNLDEYFIDVPDIRPIQKQRVRETSDSVLDVFDKVNSYYHWRYLPLGVEEVKSGISNYMKYGNTRISITIGNTYSVLNKLISNGQLVECAEYYTPKKWIDESGYSAEYLTIYRKLRDFCIANSMLFTELGTVEKADMIVTNKGVQSYLKIYPGNAKIKDIEISSRARTIIVFLDEDKRLSFTEKLYKSYGSNAEILKMAIEYGNTKLVDTGNLDGIKQ